MKLTVFTLFLLPVFLHAQKTITGGIRDADTNFPLAHCHISIEATTKGIVADDEGKFTLKAKPGDRLIFTFVGYRNDTVIVNQKNEYSIFLKSIPSALDEVVVTAIAQSSLIKENPISISNVTLKMIDRSNESNIIDVLAKNTPGLNVLKTGPNISKPFIRGMGFNRVLTLYDGVRQEGQQWGGEHGLEIDNYNIERAEIIKGPASLVYGSDALAGVVSLLPFTPKETDTKIHGRVLSEYQSNNGLIGNGFRVSYGSVHWLWALRGSYRAAKNYSNAVDGRVYNTGFQEKNLSTLLGYKSASGFTFFNLSLYDNLQGIPDGSRDSLTRKFTKQIFEGDNDDLKNRPLVSESELNSYTLSPLHQRIQHYRMYGKAHHQLGQGDINVLLAYSYNMRREFIHPTAPNLAGTFYRLGTTNYSVRYNAPVFHDFENSIGVNGMFQQNSVDQTATNFAIPNYNLTDFGVYAISKWKKESWSIIGGIRFDSRNIKTEKMYIGPDLNTGYDKQVYLPDTVGATLQFKEMHQHFHGLTLSLGTAYRFSEHVSIKFNFSRGYRAPSISEIASNGLDAGAHIVYIGNPNFQSEFSWQEDVGVFANFTNVSSSLSLFNKNIQNYIYLNQLTDSQGSPLTDAQGNKTIQYQQSTAQLYGLEASLNLNPSFLRGFSFNNQLTVCYGFNRNPLFENKRQQGEYLPFIPPARLISSINQEIKVRSKKISSINTFAEVDINATQNRFLELFSTETKTNGYALLNIGTSVTFFQLSKSSLQVHLQINNLLDAVYQSNMSRLKYFEYYAQAPNGRSGIYGMGRNICAKFIFSF
ncbi:MAG: TonB-dependent receptor [Bacteroidetes bacterium]|nr:TonB-dependent receptor [Bacteroidota bacterium]